jgi:hypothetical protein
MKQSKGLYRDMKTYWEVKVHLYAFLNSELDWGWVVTFTPRPLKDRIKSPRYPWDRKPGGPEAGLNEWWREKIQSLFLPRIEKRSFIPQPCPYTNWATSRSNNTDMIWIQRGGMKPVYSVPTVQERMRFLTKLRNIITEQDIVII